MITFSCLTGCEVILDGFHTLGFCFPVIGQVSVREISMVIAAMISEGMLLDDTSTPLPSG